MALQAHLPTLLRPRPHTANKLTFLLKVTNALKAADTHYYLRRAQANGPRHQSDCDPPRLPTFFHQHNTGFHSR
jgi:hypothetical protein